MAKFIEAIEGIGTVYSAKLRKIGRSSPPKLLKDSATRKGRKAIAGKADISEPIIL